MKVVLKGIVTREDAMLSRDAGVEGVQGAIPVFVDGGIRRARISSKRSPLERAQYASAVPICGA